MKYKLIRSLSAFSFATLSFSSLAKWSSQPQVKGCRIEAKWDVVDYYVDVMLNLCNSLSREWQELLQRASRASSTHLDFKGGCQWRLARQMSVFAENFFICDGYDCYWMLSIVMDSYWLLFTVLDGYHWLCIVTDGYGWLLNVFQGYGLLLNFIHGYGWLLVTYGH